MLFFNKIQQHIRNNVDNAKAVQWMLETAKGEFETKTEKSKQKSIAYYTDKVEM